MASKRRSKLPDAAAPPAPAPAPARNDSSSEKEEGDLPPKKSTLNSPKPNSAKAKSHGSSLPPPPAREDDDSSSDEEEEEIPPLRKSTSNSPKPKDDEEEAERESIREEEKHADRVKSQPPPKSAPQAPDSKPMVEESPSKRAQFFSRIWREEDEMKILEVAAAYHTETGSDPVSSKEMDAIYERMKMSVGPHINRAKLYSKIQELKRVFKQKAARAEKGILRFTKLHNQKLYELSQNIWGQKEFSSQSNSTMANDAQKKKKRINEDSGVAQKKKKQKINEEEEEEVYYPFIMEAVQMKAVQEKEDSMSEIAIKRAMLSVSKTKARALEKKLIEIELVKMETRLKWLGIAREFAELLKDGLRKQI